MAYSAVNMDAQDDIGRIHSDLITSGNCPFDVDPFGIRDLAVLLVPSGADLPPSVGLFLQVCGCEMKPSLLVWRTTVWCCILYYVMLVYSM